MTMYEMGAAIASDDVGMQCMRAQGDGDPWIYSSYSDAIGHPDEDWKPRYVERRFPGFDRFDVFSSRVVPR